MSYPRSHPSLVAFHVRGLEAEVKVPCSQTMGYEPPTRASLCVSAALVMAALAAGTAFAVGCRHLSWDAIENN
jgi:hypothetical protein